VTNLPHTLAFVAARVPGASPMDDALSRAEILDHDWSSPNLVAGLDNPL
jgi:hypothetical protein